MSVLMINEEILKILKLAAGFFAGCGLSLFIGYIFGFDYFVNGELNRGITLGAISIISAIVGLAGLALTEEHFC